MWRRKWLTFKGPTSQDAHPYFPSQVTVYSCDGKCPSATIFNFNINSHARFCKCCRESGLQTRSVTLYCSRNSTVVEYSFQEPLDCSCQWNWTELQVHHKQGENVWIEGWIFSGVGSDFLFIFYTTGEQKSSHVSILMATIVHFTTLTLSASFNYKILEITDVSGRSFCCRVVFVHTCLYVLAVPTQSASLSFQSDSIVQLASYQLYINNWYHVDTAVVAFFMYLLLGSNTVHALWFVLGDKFSLCKNKRVMRCFVSLGEVQCVFKMSALASLQLMLN